MLMSVVLTVPNMVLEAGSIPDDSPVASVDGADTEIDPLGRACSAHESVEWARSQ